MVNKKKMLGAIYGAGVGDALGAPTELRTTQQIKDTFGGYVKDFVAAPADTFARDYPAGTVTDDFSMSYYLMKAIIAHDGQFDEQVAKEAIVAWGEDDYYFDKFAGPTTRSAIEKIKQGLPTDVDPFGLINYSGSATNGGAMKTIPLAILAAGDWDQALAYTIAMCRPTHYNSNAIAAAAAVCCAATEALTDQATLDSIGAAAVWGAKKGREYGEAQQHISVGPDIAYKIQEAREVGQQAADFDTLLADTSDKIGTNFLVQESIPALFALLEGVKGDTMCGIYAGVNVGGDTDTIASMLGGILGAYNGIDSIPESYVETIQVQNPALAIEQTVNEFIDLCSQLQS